MKAKLRNQFILLVALVVSITFLGTSYIGLRNFVKKERNDFLLDASTLSSSTARALSVGLRAQSSLASLKDILSMGPYRIFVFNTEGEVLIANPLGESTPAQDFLATVKSLDLANLSKLQIAMTKEISIQGQPNFVGVAPVPGDANLYVAVFFPKSTLWLVTRPIFSKLLWLGLALALLTTLIATLFTKRISRPLENLTRITEKMAEGEFEIKMASDSQDEVGRLSRSFTLMGHKLKERENRIKSMAQDLALSEKLAILGQFSAGVAHEIKNPLGNILANIQLAERKIEKGQEGATTLKTAINEVYRANQILADILTFARQDRPSIAKIELDKFLHTFYETQKVRLEAQNIMLSLDISNPNMIASFDPRLITEVLGNLLDNARDALLDHPKGNMQIVLGMAVENSTLKIFVKDNGPGIPEEIRRKVFDPFFTTKPGKKGTGLGLATAYSILAMHDGSLSVESSSSDGANFILKIPQEKK
ncbi:MAG: HAMP domain-containing histidine kinase [Bdellovibrio sp.]|nr:HAMP domain-containing histidine kinase [Bdellovibrio sp.]